MSTSSKRFVIKPLRHHQPMDIDGAKQTWNVLSNAIDEIYNRNASQLSFEELYRNAYNLVLHKHGTFLYDGVSEKISLHLQDTVQSILSDTSTESPQLLDKITVIWNEHLITMTMIRDILMYMDRTYVHQARRRPVYELGLHLFRIAVWEHPFIGKRVVNLVLQVIKDERLGYSSTITTTSTSAAAASSSVVAASTAVAASANMDVDNSTTTEVGAGGTDDHDRTFKVKQVLQMLQLLSRADYTTNVYQDFEQVFLATTQEFYHGESLDYISNNSASQYVYKATCRLSQERERAHILNLPNTTEGPLLQIIQTEFIERHAKTLVDLENSGFAALLKDAGSHASGGTESNDDDRKLLLEMQQMYDLFVRVPSSVDHLRDALADRIKTDGKLLMMDQEKGNGNGASDPSAFCRGVLIMRDKFQTIVEISFRNEKKAQKRMKESFEFFLNFDARAASCLAVYVDELLRTGLRGQSDDMVQQELLKAIIVFRYLSDKDVFESFYKQHLAKRLLGGRSVSDDAERAMVSLLKAECGYQFTTKLEGMFNDMRISRETRDKYKAFKRQEQESKNNNNNNSRLLDIEVDVLTTGYWPSQNVPPCTLPVEVQQAIDRFSTFYLEKHTGRKLSWQTSTGAAELRATFGTAQKPRKHELCVSTYQMCILLLYNDPETTTLTLGQIRTKTHIPDLELRRHLISLCTPKNRILKKGSKGKGITCDADTFTFNADYTSKLKRVRIPLVKDSSITQAPGGGASGGDGAAGGVGSASGGGSAAANNASSSVMNGAVPMAVEEDRRHLVEASIVRIMKARKSLNHNDLIAEVTRQLSNRFQPSPQFIKKRIESLIEREYLERSESEHRVYMYVA